MKDKCFIDTNILVYANDRSVKAKSEKAKKILLDGIREGNIALSTQVLGEFYVTVTQKIKVKLPVDTATKEIRLLAAVETAEIDYHSVLQAVDIAVQYRLSYLDSLIIASALKTRCNILYSEDLHHGQTIGGVTLVNPFL